MQGLGFDALRRSFEEKEAREAAGEAPPPHDLPGDIGEAGRAVSFALPSGRLALSVLRQEAAELERAVEAGGDRDTIRGAVVRTLAAAFAFLREIPEGPEAGAEAGQDGPKGAGG